MTKPTHSFVKAWRICGMLLHTLYGAVIAVLILPYVSVPRRNAIIGHWSSRLLRIMRFKVIVRGHVPSQQEQGVMFVANHISWADIHALNSVLAVRFIAKSEIRGWPVFGWFAQKTNTLFIDREKRHDAGRIVTTVSHSLQAGDRLCYFPEGTTTDGSHIKPFKASIMQAAIDTQTRVWPFCIRYLKPDGSYNTDIAYYGDVTLKQSLSAALSQRAPVVELIFAEPIEAHGLERRQLSQMALQEITSRFYSKA